MADPSTRWYWIVRERLDYSTTSACPPCDSAPADQQARSLPHAAVLPSGGGKGPTTPVLPSCGSALLGPLRTLVEESGRPLARCQGACQVTCAWSQGCIRGAGDTKRRQLARSPLIASTPAPLPPASASRRIAGGAGGNRGHGKGAAGQGAQATRFRYQGSKVSGVTIRSIPATVLRLSFLAFVARRRRWPIGETETPVANLLPEDSILFQEILDDILLAAVHPARGIAPGAF